MTYDTEQMTFLGTPGTPAENAALQLHYEIMAAAQAAASSLLNLARKIKQMRDTGGYRALGFATLEEYTAKTMGMKQRQAYNYIAIAEKLPAQLIEQNAAAGVTKLALLAQLSAGEQQQMVADTNLTDTTVAELKQKIRELQAKNAGYAEQLSILQEAAPAVESRAEEIDMDALRKEIRQEAEADLRADLAAAEQDRKERDAALAAAKQAKAELEQAHSDMETAGKAAEEAAHRKIAQAEQEKAAAEQRAAELARKMNMPKDDSMVRFGIFFDQLQEAAEKIRRLTDEVRAAGQEDKADKMRRALCRALTELAAQETA